jgi:tetratricopeptide (TPR) repeat protein
MLGNALMRSHYWLAAIPEYQASANLRPQHPDTYLNLGYALYHSGMTSQAVGAWRSRNILSIDPSAIAN